MNNRKLSDLTAVEMRHLQQMWECEFDVTAGEIGQRFRISKNAVIGCAHRRGWMPRKDRNNAALIALVKAAVAEEVGSLRKAMTSLQGTIATLAARIDKLQLAQPLKQPEPSPFNGKRFPDDPRARRNHGSPGGHGRIA